MFLSQATFERDPRGVPDVYPCSLPAMRQLVARNAQFIAATHSPIVLGYPGATIYLFGDHAPRPVAYAGTEQYQITRAFLEHPDRMLRELLRDEGDS